MSFMDKYPYTDFHELNLDWFLEKFKEMMNAYAEFTTDMTDKFNTLDATVQEFTTFVTDYFDNLDVQEEINHKLDVMAADGTLDALLLPYFNQYKAEINGIVSDQNQIIGNQNSRITVLEGRMDSFASLTEGSTTGDAELMDIRVGYNGVTYPTAGDAVREQIKDVDLKELYLYNSGVLNLDECGVIRKENLFDLDADNTTNGYYDRTNSFVSSAISGMTDFIPVIPGQKYKRSETSPSFCLWFDDNKNFLGYTNIAAGDNVETEAINGAYYGKWIFTIASINNFQITNNNIRYIDLSTYEEIISISNKVNNSITLSQNLVNKNDPDFVIDGYYDRNNTLTSATGYNQTGYIPVTEGNRYTSNVKNNFVLWYNKDKLFLGYTEVAVFLQDGYVVAPALACFSRFICQSTINDYEVWQVVEGDTLPSYMPFGAAYFTNGIEETKYKSMNGVAFGTSLTYRSETTGGYLNFLPALSQMNFDNQGIGNATILVTPDYPNLDILASIKNYANYASKDVCILEGFVNDWFRNHDKLGTWTDNDETTVCGCVRSAINYIFSENEDITVFMILDHCGQGVNASTAKNQSNMTQLEYYNEIAKVAESMGVHVIWELKESEISENTPQYLLDNIHLTMLGAEQSANVIWCSMKQWVPNIAQ